MENRKRNIIFVFSILLLGCLLFICVINFILANKADPVSGTLVSGYLNISRRESITSSGAERFYKIYIPAEYSLKERYPLLLVFHGDGGTPDSIEQATGFTSKAEKENFIVVYPEGTPEKESSVGFTWNSYHCCGMALENNSNDVLFIKNLLESLSKNYQIDPLKIYATGFSNGGILTYKLAEELPENFRAIAVVSATIGGKVDPNSPQLKIQNAKALPVAIFHGKEDRSIYYQGGKSEGIYQNRLDLSINDSFNFWVANNKCPSNTKLERKISDNVDLTSYSRCDNESQVLLYSINNQGHAWPGDTSWERTLRKTTADKPTTEISATQEIWDFFSGL